MWKNIKVSETFGFLNKSVKFTETRMVQLGIKILLLVSWYDLHESLWAFLVMNNTHIQIVPIKPIYYTPQYFVVFL